MRLPQPQFALQAALKPQDIEKFDALAVAVQKDEDGLHFDSTGFSHAVITRLNLDTQAIVKSWPDYAAKSGEILELPIDGLGKVSRLYLVGVGKSGREELRRAGASLGRKVKGNGFTILVTSFSDGASSELRESAIAFVAALSISHYGFEIKSAGAKQKRAGNTFTVSGALSYEVARAQVLSDAIWNARDLIHTPSNIKNPEWMAQQAKALVKAAHSSSLTVSVKSGRQLAQFGGLRAVGNSAPIPGPRMIEVRYAPTGSRNWPHVVLVGKGITFDTGGISLKRPYDSMVAMKSDMAGSAAILAATCAMTKIKPKVRVTALMMCAENMVSGTAQRPSDVITQYGGTTVEVINTDAEGRLVLADGLAYADLELSPDYLIDVATLTGAASMGLGKQYAAMYTRDSKLAQTLSDVGERTSERVWHMPLVDDYAPALESDVADLVHTADKVKFSAGSVTAALFLEQFVGERRWVHLDIAGPGRSDVDSGEYIKGGTAFGARLLIEWLASFA